MSGTLVFASDRSTVVAEAATRRDARATTADDERVASGAGRRNGRKTVLDLPDVDRPKRDRDGGELVN